MLILEIALGMVAGVFLLACLPTLIGFALLLGPGTLTYMAIMAKTGSELGAILGFLGVTLVIMWVCKEIRNA